MKKLLITTTILIFTIITIKTEQQEAFLWGVTLLHIFISWCITKEIKNKALRSLIFIALMGTIIISINMIKPIINSFSLNEACEIFEKSGKAVAELSYRISKREWRQFNISETLRRSLFGVVTSLSLLTLFLEGAKKTILKKERR